jgi:AraC family transcriptional regulator
MTGVTSTTLRLRKALQHIEDHLEEALTVERLSEVAALSKYHFHRQFSQRFGIGVYKYIQLVRLRRASYQLAFRPHMRIIDIALACGYESHEAFTRAFRRNFTQAPSEFRDRPQWQAWHSTCSALNQLRSEQLLRAPAASSVQLRNFPETRSAVLPHRGDPALLGESLRRFIEWRRENRLPPARSATFNLLYDDPGDTPPEHFRLDLCAVTEAAVAANRHGVVPYTIPAGRCAVLRHVGPDDTLGSSLRYLYGEWLPQSGETLRDFPPFLQRLSFLPDLPEHELTSDIFLPLA